MALTQAGTVRLFGSAVGGTCKLDTAAFPNAEVTGWTYTRAASTVSEVRVGNVLKTKIWDPDQQEATLQLNVVFGYSGCNDAQARASAAMPETGRKVTTSGFPVIVDGKWSDCLNSSTDWQFVDGSITGTIGEAFTGTVTLSRAYGITLTT